MNRRDFLAGLGGVALAGCATDDRRNTGAVGTVELRPPIGNRQLGPGFVGLSYETSLLASPLGFLSAGNHALVALIQGLGAQGLIRIGGSSSEFAQWQPTPGPLTRPMRYSLTPAHIERLATLLDATGWRVVYGLNLGNGSADAAADEAAYVARRLGERLAAFQIGNEPDLYERAGLRPSGYGVSDYIGEWKHYAQAIRARAGDVPFAGPDVAYTAEWIESFARACGSEVQFLSDHYYPIGPPSNPQADIVALLRSEIDRYPRLRSGIERVLGYGKPLRITEGNSCWDGGKSGVSDTMAAALWGANTLFDCAHDGASGFCFHGGPDAIYTPIARDSRGIIARPLYYGMRLFAAAGGGRFMETHIDSLNRGLRAHALQSADGGMRLAILNLGQAQATDVRINAIGHKLTGGSVLRLSAPTLFSTSQVSFGGAVADIASGALSPQPETLAIDSSNGTGLVTVSAASAVLVQLG